MLYWLGYEKLFHLYSPFRVFGYATFRTGMAFFTAMLLSILIGPWLIARLREFQIGQHIREDGPQSHQKKAGTPTMGGVLIIISIVIPTLLWADLRDSYVWVALFSLVSYGAIGFFDDYAKILQRRNLGFTARKKLVFQVISAFALAALLLTMHARGIYKTNINLPFFKQYKPDLLIDSFLSNFWTYPLAFLFFFGFVTLVLVGASNAVNLTDGLDGLAIGLMVVAAGALTILTYASGHSVWASYLELDTNS